MAKRQISEWFGWKSSNIIDLGDITNSRGTKMFVELWVRLWAPSAIRISNIRVVREK